MIIGVDFDNTIVCYDDLFYRVAVERGYIPKSVPKAKDSVRDHMHSTGQYDAWTELQGHIYGPGMKLAKPFPGALDFFARCRAQGISVHIISHRTRYPFLGPKHDLLEAARAWLEQWGFHDPARIGLARSHTHFELTRQDKLARILRVGCAYFVDDLPEFLGESDFPRGVRRILFDPSGEHKASLGVARARSWKEVGEMLVPEEQKPIEGRRLEAAAADLLAAVGRDGRFALKNLPGAANNRVFRLERDGESFLLKAYFRHEKDPRDRLGAEFAFSTFLWENGVRAIPQPLAADHVNQLGLYEFVEGRPPRPGQTSQHLVDQALGFFQAVNRFRDLPAARSLPQASEACYSLADHLQCVERRLETLKGFEPRSDGDARAADFVKSELSRAWPGVFDSVCRGARKLGVPLVKEIEAKDRCLSPSDFGFHNAVLEGKDRLRFLDFEYAGWDDPSKMVCDFFCQQAVPVPLQFFQKFAQGAVAHLRKPEAHLRRISLLLPVYRFKWCCILLNDFLPVGTARRRFAQQDLDGESRKEKQLEKARLFLKDLLVAAP